MEKSNINQLINIGENFADGTAVMYYAINKLNNKIGVLKANGCMLGVDHENIREKLGSTIFNECNIPCAKVDLFVDDEGKEYAFSYNVLQANESHIKINVYPIDDSNNNESYFCNYMKVLKMKILLIPGISKIEIDDIFSRMLSIILINCLIENYDSATNNMKIIKNDVTNRFRPPIAYDNGVAFHNGIQRTGIFFRLSNDEVVSFLFKYFPEQIKEASLSIQNNLTDNYIDTLFNEPFLDENNKEDFKQILLKHRNQINTFTSTIFNNSEEVYKKKKNI